MCRPIILLTLLLYPVFLYAGHESKSGITHVEALKRLKEGHRRYLSGNSRDRHHGKKSIHKVIREQHPFATILGCSDSREAVELIFDADIGDLFVIRVAGNVVSADQIASIEYSMLHLGTPLLLVLGHTACGAVNAAKEATGRPGHGNIPSLLKHITPAIEKARANNIPEDEIIDYAVTENVFQAISDILLHSVDLRRLIMEGKIHVVGAVYDLHTGHITYMEDRSLRAEAMVYSVKSPEQLIEEVELHMLAWLGGSILLVMFGFMLILSEKVIESDPKTHLSWRIGLAFFCAFIPVLYYFTLILQHMNAVQEDADIENQKIAGLMLSFFILALAIMVFSGAQSRIIKFRKK